MKKDLYLYVVSQPKQFSFKIYPRDTQVYVCSVPTRHCDFIYTTLYKTDHDGKTLQNFIQK